MNVLTEMSMPLYRGEYKRLVSGEDCQIVAKEAIKQLLERTMDVALQERITRHVGQRGVGSDRRNGYYERDLLTATVVEKTADGRDLLAVRFRLDRPLGDPDLLFLRWDGEAFRPIDLAALPTGERVELADTSDVWASMI